jgi:uncharacterized protein
MGLNVLGGELEPCGLDPITGFYRDGCCTVGAEDVGVHAVCAEMTETFLAYSIGPATICRRPGPSTGSRA